MNDGNFGGVLNVTGTTAGLDIKGGKTGGGVMLAGSMIQTGYLGKAKVTAYQTDNGATEFGIYTGGSDGIQIADLKLLPTDLPFVDGDFAVRIV